MASCKDCVHVEVCNSRCPDPNNERLICEQFKDRCRFVELPCAGNKVYELCRVNLWGDYIIGESIVKKLIVETDGTAFDYELLGKRFFLTREEAERALKEPNGH